jgi:glycosyltransferase involved in cell wall biosynthesis
MKKPNVLLVTARAPWPTASGGQQRTFLLAEAIRRVGILHTLLINPRPQPQPGDIEVMRERFGLVDGGIFSVASASKWNYRINPGKAELGPLEPIAEIIARTARRLACDTVVFRYLSLAAKSAGSQPDGIRRLVDIDDVPSLRTRTEIGHKTGIRKLGKKWIAKSIAKWQRQAISRLDGGWVSCQSDLDIIQDDKFTILPNIPLDAFDGTSDSALCEQNRESRSVLFVGDMAYPINARAMDWFLENVWPLVIRQQPDATMQIAGRGLDDTRQRIYSAIDGVRLLGFVKDLAAVYMQSAVSIVPISAGAGTKIKVLESLRYGRPVVLTSHSLRGYEHVLKNEREVLVADEPLHMASSIVRMINEPESREAMARSGQTLVEKNFGFDRFAALVADVLIGAR